MRIVCVGDLGVDRYMPGDKQLPGGITANFARQARRCFEDSDEIQIISVVGTDEDEAATALSSVNIPGIECHIAHLEGKTPVQYIEVNDNGERNFTAYEPGVLDRFEIDKHQAAVMEKADLIMTPVYWQIHNVFDAVFSIQTNAVIAVDFSDFSTDPDFELLERYANRINIAFFGLTADQTELIEGLMEIAVRKNILCVITLAENGCMAIADAMIISEKAVPVTNVVDTTGAGDAFAAGFLSTLMHEGNVKDALQYGAKIAARTVQHLGSVPPKKPLVI